jgi:hypothetical protein
LPERANHAGTSIDALSAPTHTGITIDGSTSGLDAIFPRAHEVTGTRKLSLRTGPNAIAVNAYIACVRTKIVAVIDQAVTVVVNVVAALVTPGNLRTAYQGGANGAFG